MACFERGLCELSTLLIGYGIQQLHPSWIEECIVWPIPTSHGRAS